MPPTYVCSDDRTAPPTPARTSNHRSRPDMAPKSSDADENLGNAGAQPPRELGTQMSLSPVMSDVGSTASSPNTPTFLLIPRAKLAPTRQLDKSSFLNS